MSATQEEGGTDGRTGGRVGEDGRCRLRGYTVCQTGSLPGLQARSPKSFSRNNKLLIRTGAALSLTTGKEPCLLLWP